MYFGLSFLHKEQRCIYIQGYLRKDVQDSYILRHILNKKYVKLDRVILLLKISDKFTNFIKLCRQNRSFPFEKSINDIITLTNFIIIYLKERQIKKKTQLWGLLHHNSVYKYIKFVRFDICHYLSQIKAYLKFISIQGSGWKKDCPLSQFSGAWSLKNRLYI